MRVNNEGLKTWLKYFVVKGLFFTKFVKYVIPFSYDHF